MFKKYLLSSVAFAPDRGGNQPADDEPDEELPDPAGDEQDTGDVDPPDEDPGNPDTEDPDDADEDAEADQGEQPDQGGAQPQSRGNRQYAALRASNRQRAEENARLTRELDDIKRQIAAGQNQQRQPDPHAEAERRALLSTEERMREDVERSLQGHAQRTDALMGQLLDNSDKDAFARMQQSGPRSALARKLGPQVERELAGLRQRGQNLTREAIFTHLVGQRVLAQMDTGKKGKAQERLRRETVPARRNGGDINAAPQSRRNGGGDIVSRTERDFGDVQI